VAERNEFMEKLAADRAIRLYVENDAATKIQAMFRGFMKRPHSEAAADMKRQLIYKRALKRGKPTVRTIAPSRLTFLLSLLLLCARVFPKLFSLSFNLILILILIYFCPSVGVLCIDAVR
jgi:hypothetical protein